MAASEEVSVDAAIASDVSELESICSLKEEQITATKATFSSDRVRLLEHSLFFSNNYIFSRVICIVSPGQQCIMLSVICVVSLLSEHGPYTLLWCYSRVSVGPNEVESQLV